MARLCRTLCLFLVMAIGAALLSGEARAQPLPIPGLPGGLGGVATPDAPPDAPADAPTGADGQADPGSTPDADPSAGPPGGSAGDTLSDPARALIDILRDDAAREALIRELESAASADPAEAPAPEAEPVETFADRAVDATREVGGAVFVELENAWLRVKRIPNTIRLSTRIFEDGALQRALGEILWPALFIYGTLLVLRLLVRPIRRHFGRAAEDARWLKTLVMRILASALDLVTLPLAVIVGLTALVLTGFATAGESEEVQLSDAQALFVNAFVAIEGALVAVRFVLSANSPSLRVLSLPDRGARSLWYLGLAVAYVLGYGQLLIVPLIGSGVSVFVGRAAGAMLSVAVVATLILYVFLNRKRVAAWLTAGEKDSALVTLMRPALVRWHWPVLTYLAYLFISVLTSPGNVLLPLLQTTGEVALIIIFATMVLTALNERALHRVRIPSAVAERLPLLEERINQIRPAFLTILRAFVLIVALLVALNMLGLQGIGGLITGTVLEQLSSGVLSVLLIAAVLSLAWLALTSWVDYRLNPFVGSVPTSREVTLLTLMKNAATVALIIVGAITSLAQLGMNVGPLIASAGVIGLAISFGAQRMVEDIFSGIFIQAENAMNVGDVVDVGGTVGTVEKLTVRSVTLRDLSGVVHVIPFSSAAKISNYMRDYAYHVADIGVAYREDVEEVRLAMHDAFDRLIADPERAEHVVGELEWFGLNAFGPSELMMRARIKTVPGQQWGIGRAYNALVKDIFDERGIEIPFPHQTVYFGEDKAGAAPPLNLRVQRPGRRTPADSAQAEGGSGPRPAAEADAPDDPAKPPHDAARDDRVKGADIPDEDGR